MHRAGKSVLFDQRVERVFVHTSSAPLLTPHIGACQKWPLSRPSKEPSYVLSRSDDNTKVMQIPNLSPWLGVLARVSRARNQSNNVEQQIKLTILALHIENLEQARADPVVTCRCWQGCDGQRQVMNGGILLRVARTCDSHFDTRRHIIERASRWIRDFMISRWGWRCVTF